MKFAIFFVIIIVLGITTERVYTTVKRDHGFGCSQDWTFLGEEDLQTLDERNLTGSPKHFKLNENVIGTIKNFDIRHSPGLASLSTSMFISNNSDLPFSTDLLMKLVHKDKEYQMEKVMIRSEASIINTPNEPLRLNLEPNTELYISFFFTYVAERQLTRVTSTFNCIFGIGHSMKPG